ncbi:MAG: GEVED domain-containing protein [Rivularia sp. (in: cyanobacteria)]
MFATSPFYWALPTLAQTAPGSTIDNTATGSFEDPDNLGTVTTVESNTVSVTVAEVAGITISQSALPEEAPSGVSGAGANQGNNEINPDDVIYFTYTITNVGNDATQFFIPGAPSNITNGTLSGNIEIIEYDPDGSGATAATDLSGSPVTVPSGGISTGDAAALNLPNGSIPPNGTVTIRVPIKASATLTGGDSVIVVMGDTPPNDNSAATQNQVYSAGTNDVYTQDNPDGTAGETDGTPVNGDATNNRQEASYSQNTTVLAPTNQLLPVDNSMVYCPAPTLETPYTDYRIAWTYNSPTNTLLPDHQPWPNQQFDQTQIATAPAQTIGSGMNYTFDGDKQTVIHLSNVDQSDPIAAINAGDYIEYEFTTTTTMDLERLFNGLAFARHGYTQNYDIAIILSKDNFATATTLLSDYTVQTSGGSYEWTPIPTNRALHLDPNTTYKFRIVFYNATNPGAVYWDDFHLSMGGCRDYSDAPIADYDSASHGLPPVITHYLGNSLPDAEREVRDGGDAGVNADGDDTGGNTPDDEDGVTIPSLIPGETAVIDVQVTGDNGYLQAWMDWDGDGNFTTAGDQIATNVQDGGTGDLDGAVNGVISLAVNVPASASTTTYARFRWSTEQNLDSIIHAADGEVEDYFITIAPAVANNANLTLVKRITAVNGTSINTTVDDTTDNSATTEVDESTFDNEANWPTPVDANGISQFLRGDISRSNIKPGDELEYSVYFLSSGDKPITNTKICDMIPANTTFVPGSMQLFLNGTTTNLSDTSGDGGQFFAPGNTPTIACPTDNGKGAIVIDVVTSPTQLPNATAPGTPTDSYGYIRFRVRVD